MNLFGVVVAEFPLHADALALAIAVDTLLVATELWVVSRQQHQTSQDARPELFEQVGVAMVAVDLPVRCCRAQIDDSGMTTGWFGNCCCF